MRTCETCGGKHCAKGLCKKCYKKEYEQIPEVKERTRTYQNEYNKRPYVQERKKEYRQRPEVRKRNNEDQKKRRQRPEAKERKRKWSKEYYQRPGVKEAQRIRSSKPEYKAKRKEYRQIPEVKANLKEYVNHKKLTDANFNITVRLRKVFSQALNHYSKTGKIMEARKYGINYKEIIEHLKPFPENLSAYHIDHIIPLSSFDFNDPEQIKEAFAPENHQWLTAEENLRKGAKM